jgi:hypothetical protein
MKPTEIAQQLWDLLWQDYRDRVTYARIYQQMIEEAGGSIANDHIAFRTLRLTIDQNGHSIQLGIPYIIFQNSFSMPITMFTQSKITMIYRSCLLVN